MTETVRRQWWLVVAALIAVMELVVSAGIWIDKLTAETVLLNGTEVELPGEALLVWGDIALTGLLALAAAAIIAGLSARDSQPDRSRWLIMAGLVPAALLGVVFFWFPPFWIVSGAAIAVIARISTRGAGKELLTA
jgi:hypothetical protein